MSLDVYLTGKTTQVACECTRCLNGHKRDETEEFYQANITHNLGKMASEAGIYEALWRPEEVGITKAGQLVGPLETGLALLRSDPARFEKFNAENGWGSYENLVSWVGRYLVACKNYPDANVRASR